MGAAGPSSVGHRPSGPWEFDDNVVQVFDDMLRRSIPQYEVMRRVVFEVGCEFIGRNPKTDVVDLGCSKGDVLSAFYEKFGAYNRYVGCDVSPPMLAAARQRFGGAIENGLVLIHETDIRVAYPPVRASFTASVLTLQFTPIEHRLQILARVFEHTLPGGAFMLVEKLMGSDPAADALLSRHYREHKLRAGYSVEDVDVKAKALEGELVPLPAQFNEEFLRRSGFRTVECVWRWMNFAAWVAIR